MIQLPTMTTTRTFTGKGWRTARIATFDNFLTERAVRLSGRGPWTMEDGIQVIREYLIYRLLVTNSTYAVLVYLEQRASAILKQVVGRRTTCRPSSTRQRTLGEGSAAKQQASSVSFSRAYATPLYHQVQDRLFAWTTSFAPVRMGRVDLRALHVWANNIKQICRRMKSGQVQDVWRITDTNEKLVVNWAPTSPAKSKEDLRIFFVAWLNHLVGPTLATIAGDEEVQVGHYLIGLRQRLEDEVDRWLLDFPVGACAGPGTQGRPHQDALQAIIAQCSKGRR